MKRFLSFMIAAIMLLSTCALAEGKALTIGNIMIGDNTGFEMDFSGVELKLSAAGNDTSAGVSAAVLANGEEAARAVLSLDENGIYLSANDISDVYSISADMIEMLIAEIIGDVNIEEMLEAYLDEIAAAFESYSASLMECITDYGVQEYDGVEYQVYSVDLDHEHCMAAYALYDAILAPFPQIWEGTGYTSIVNMFETEGVEVSMYADFLISDEGIIMDMYAYMDDEAIINLFCTVEDSYYENADMNGMDIYMALYDPSYDDVDEGYLGYAFLTIYTDPETEEFTMVDLMIGDAEDNDDETIYIGLKPFCANDEDVAFFTVSTMDDSEFFNVGWATTDEDLTVMIDFCSESEDVSMNITYWMPADGCGGIDMSFVSGEEEAYIGAEITISEDDGAWLPEIGETVDIMTIDDAQLEKLTGEAMVVLSKVISACASANSDIAQLMAELM